MSQTQTLSSGTSIGRGKTVYEVVKKSQPPSPSKKSPFEIKHNNISDERAAKIANGMSPEDQHKRRDPRKQKSSFKKTSPKSWH
jgi:hypothetical protein